MLTNHIAQIDYPPEYRNAIDEFWTGQGRLDEDMLELTWKILDMNEGHYTVWQYRRKILLALSSDLKEELDRVREFTHEHPKNYQVWHHRQWIVERLQVYQEELDATISVFCDDAKNYHAWIYRMWLAEKVEDWEGEVEFAQELIRLDLYNNSAWNYLLFLGKRVPTSQAFIEQKILLDPDNASTKRVGDLTLFD